LLLPKWEFTLAISLRNTLAALGMPAAFTPDMADFSGIDGAHDLYIKDVVEKATVAVAEQGTEAGAATSVVIATHAAEKVLAVDRPFVFLIRHRPTGALLFLGRVLDPQQAPQ
jgi:serpin B